MVLRDCSEIKVKGEVRSARKRLGAQILKRIPQKPTKN